jgi:hypothetical protein
MENLAKAIIAVMQEVKGIEKTMTIGTGSSAYKGVPDQEVKKIIGDSMAKNGLCILPIGVKPKIQIDRWEETAYDNYQKKEVTKQKQSVFTEVTTEYLLLHTSGESQVLSGYGHGIDSQDKGAGKSTTYALKYVLLYTFLVPTGKIDDSDNTHSDNIQIPNIKPKQPIQQPTVDEVNAKIINAKNLSELQTLFLALPVNEQKLAFALKEQLKAVLK